MSPKGHAHEVSSAIMLVVSTAAFVSSSKTVCASIPFMETENVTLLSCSPPESV